MCLCGVTAPNARAASYASNPQSSLPRTVGKNRISICFPVNSCIYRSLTLVITWGSAIWALKLVDEQVSSVWQKKAPLITASIRPLCRSFHLFSFGEGKGEARHMFGLKKNGPRSLPFTCLVKGEERVVCVKIITI